MSVFLTPDGRPFYGGTYFPDAPRHGMPSFRQVLDGVWQAWTRGAAELEGAAGGSSRRSPAAGARDGRIGPARRAALRPRRRRRAAAIEASFDPATGGWGGRPSSRSR